ncbi:HesB/YadR/YfhF family protein [Secundilactobacillus folii]|uniref:Iron-sulfur cluster biosynthesis protein n=1 Tax=Secundilactobacillus folii TaxID=2678357 RepID=A0A7X2XV92_9LACO|nr:iron-sulfur cluster biosynthesis protein [Secundilactobacillus folii]MTV82263.1 iron-sulfur cluster biosynthesis protein [Secundilactobacillus folii]
MKLQVTDAASKWFEDEMNVGPDQPAAIRFYGKLYGKTKVHEGFSVGLARELQPHSFGVKFEKNGVTYYIEEGDLWFFKGYDLNVDYDPKIDENNVQYDWKENGELD